MCDPIKSSQLVRPIISELHVNAEVFVFQFGDYILKSIAVPTRNANDVSLNRCLHLGLAILDETHNLFCFFLWNALLNLSALTNSAAGGRFHGAVAQRLQRHA